MRCHEALRPLQYYKRGMAFVEVTHLDSKPKRLQQAATHQVPAPSLAGAVAPLHRRTDHW